MLTFTNILNIDIPIIEMVCLRRDVQHYVRPHIEGLYDKIV